MGSPRYSSSKCSATIPCIACQIVACQLPLWASGVVSDLQRGKRRECSSTVAFYADRLRGRCLLRSGMRPLTAHIADEEGSSNSSVPIMVRPFQGKESLGLDAEPKALSPIRSATKNATGRAGFSPQLTMWPSSPRPSMELLSAHGATPVDSFIIADLCYPDLINHVCWHTHRATSGLLQNGQLSVAES